jgi:predicted PurR-regulated permease PerM
VERSGRYANASLIILAVLGVVAALYFLKPILVPIALAILLASMLSPVTGFVRRILPISTTGAAVLLFIVTALGGLYVASLIAQSLIEASETLPTDVERLAGRLSNQVSRLSKDSPFLRNILPEPGTIDVLGDANRNLLISKLRYGLPDLMYLVGQGIVVMVFVLFLLAESEMLSRKLIHFFARSSRDARAAEAMLKSLNQQIRSFLVTRTLINIGMGFVVTLALWAIKVKFAVALGIFAALTNFIPYVGQVVGGALPTLVTLAQYESIGGAVLVASIYTAVVVIEGYVVTPYILGKSLDLNGTVILVACLFWGFLWGLIGLVLAMPLTACMKLVFQAVPDLHRWAELMSRDWTSPPVEAQTVPSLDSVDNYDLDADSEDPIELPVTHP